MIAREVNSNRSVDHNVWLDRLQSVLDKILYKFRSIIEIYFGVISLGPCDRQRRTYSYIGYGFVLWFSFSIHGFRGRITFVSP